MLPVSSRYPMPNAWRRAAEEARPSEAAAALTMQRCWRGSVAREEVTRKL